MKLTRNKVFTIIIITLVIAAVAVWYFGVISVKPEKASTTENKDTVATKTDTKATPKSKYASLTGDAFDEQYIADMLAHHEAAASMSEQAMAVTAHDQLFTLASNIVQVQSREMMQMRDWQKAWGFEITNSGGHMSHGGGGAEMSVDADTNAKRQEIKDLAQDVITAQTAEIKQMKAWQKEWGYES